MFLMFVLSMFLRVPPVGPAPIVNVRCPAPISIPPVGPAPIVKIRAK